MECPECGAELIWDDSYGTRDFICHGDIKGKRGDIYICPNREGFEDKEEAIEYAKAAKLEYDEKNWEDIVCSSADHNGFYYTDGNDDLREGYPC